MNQIQGKIGAEFLNKIQLIRLGLLHIIQANNFM